MFFLMQRPSLLIGWTTSIWNWIITIAIIYNSETHSTYNVIVNPVRNYNIITPIHIDWLYLVNDDRAGHLLLWDPPTLHACCCCCLCCCYCCCCCCCLLLLLLPLLLPLLLGRGVPTYLLPTNICCCGGVCSPSNYCLQLLLQLVRGMYIPSLTNCWAIPSCKNHKEWISLSIIIIVCSSCDDAHCCWHVTAQLPVVAQCCQSLHYTLPCVAELPAVAGCSQVLPKSPASPPWCCWVASSCLL